MLILGLNKTTLLDYPGCVAAVIFTGGCNFCCPFCHNRSLVLEPSAQEACLEEEIFSFLRKRKNVLKGVCITGGEPTLQADLPDFIRKVKKLGYRVKLDTNGYEPEVLKRLIEEGLLDYVAMDIKNCREKYALTVGRSRCGEGGRSPAGRNGHGEGGSFQIGRIERSAEILKKSGIDYELRTTVVRELHTAEDLLGIGEWIRGCPRYYLQQYQDNENVICGGFHGFEKSEMEEMAAALRRLPGMTGEVALRGVE